LPNEKKLAARDYRKNSFYQRADLERNFRLNKERRRKRTRPSADKLKVRTKLSRASRQPGVPGGESLQVKKQKKKRARAEKEVVSEVRAANTARGRDEQRETEKLPKG